MNVQHTLNEKLLLQAFEDSESADSIAKYQHVAQTYAVAENSLSVLSDLRANKSYIYSGGVTPELGIHYKSQVVTIDSIWEEEIFERIKSEDLLEKHAQELKFFHLLKGIPANERCDYQVVSTLRMLDKHNKYTPVLHRMFYLQSTADGSIWLALCLYNFSLRKEADKYEGAIINTRTGEVIKSNDTQFKSILTAREKAVLQLIKKGKRSKEIAASLSISINTINRHRQNILEKLHVTNSMEACRIAESLNLI